MYSQNRLTLINPKTGALAFGIGDVDASSFSQLERFSYFSIIWIRKAGGTLITGFAEYPLQDQQVLFFSPFRPFLIRAEGEIEGEVLHFHPDFFCIYKHDKEVGCNGVLFNNLYDPPAIALNEQDALLFGTLFNQLKDEMQKTDISQFELLVSYLKILLINAVRMKARLNPALARTYEEESEPFMLQKLKDHIEDHFREKHSPSDYAELLNISPKALGKLTKNHFNRTLTSLIADRIIIEAKRELYLTSKPIKQIAYEVGFQDEYYFSRFFKNNADVSPQAYRDAVGFAKAEV